MLVRIREPRRIMKHSGRWMKIEEFSLLRKEKLHYSNRPVVKFEIAAHKQIKITELRLAKCFSTKPTTAPAIVHQPASITSKVEEDRVSIIGSHLISAHKPPQEKRLQVAQRTRPPITTHVLDVARGRLASGIEVNLEMWKANNLVLRFLGSDSSGWTRLGLVRRMKMEDLTH